MIRDLFKRLGISKQQSEHLASQKSVHYKDITEEERQRVADALTEVTSRKAIIEKFEQDQDQLFSDMKFRIVWAIEHMTPQECLSLQLLIDNKKIRIIKPLSFE